MSWTYSLESGGTTITLNPKWDMKTRPKMERADHRMHDAGMFSYKFSVYDVFHFSVEGVTPANASQFNSWWEAQTSLTFTITRDGTPETHTVKIGGSRTPFPKFFSPQVEYYEGKLELEATTP